MYIYMTIKLEEKEGRSSIEVIYICMYIHIYTYMILAVAKISVNWIRKGLKYSPP
jgi:hypothetical protein